LISNIPYNSYVPVRFISKRTKLMRRLEFLQTMEKTMEIIPAASKATSRQAQTVVRVRDGMGSDSDEVLKGKWIRFGHLGH
jgi:hypothetical protein